MHFRCNSGCQNMDSNRNFWGRLAKVSVSDETERAGQRLLSTPELDARMACQPLGGVLRRDESVQVNFRKSLVRLGDYSLAGMGKIHEGKEVEDGGRV